MGFDALAGLAVSDVFDDDPGPADAIAPGPRAVVTALRGVPDGAAEAVSVLSAAMGVLGVDVFVAWDAAWAFSPPPPFGRPRARAGVVAA